MSTPDVAAALGAAQAAKAAYRDDPSAAARADHRSASTDLRYARWVSRGGPAEEAARLQAGLGHTNGEIAMLHARWVTENGEG